MKSRFWIILISLIGLALLIIAAFRLQSGPPLATSSRENRLAIEMGTARLALSSTEKQAGLNYAAALAKIIPIIPPLIGRPASLIKQQREMLEKANTQELQPMLSPLATAGNAGQLRLAAAKVYEAVSYCYSDDFDSQPSPSESLRLLRLTAPPRTMKEAVDGILKVCMDFGDLCDPQFSAKATAATMPKKYPK